MPIYEYQCGACGERSEVLQKISDPPAMECPLCHESQLKRLMSAAGFRLKGSGWYVTDFKDQKKKPEKPKAEAGSEPASKKTTPKDTQSTTSEKKKDE